MATAEKAKKKQARSRSGLKKARQAIKHREHNVAVMSSIRTAIKKVVKAVAAKDKKAAEAAYAAMAPVLDRQTTRGMIHKNKTARHKSRLTAAIRALA